MPTSSEAHPLQHHGSGSGAPRRVSVAASPLGTAAVFLVFSAVLRACMETTYVVAAYQMGLAPQRFYVHLAVSVTHIFVVAASYKKLKRGEPKSWVASTITAASMLYVAVPELLAFISARSQGYPRTETQICILAVFVFSLIVSLVYLARGAMRSD